MYTFKAVHVLGILDPGTSLLGTEWENTMFSSSLRQVAWGRMRVLQFHNFGSILIGPWSALQSTLAMI